jgi:predicted DNA-binding transcriptional regulator YafY
MNKVIRVRPSEKKFKAVPQEEIDAMFRYSFRSWTGTEKHHIRIRLSREWARRIKPRQLMETQKITEESDGSVIFESTVNSLTEVASWVVSRGNGVEVLEPVELKTKVIELAKGALSNYSND